MAYVTRAELRSHIGLTGSDHDSVLDQFIASASEACDLHTGRVKGTLGSGFLTHSNAGERHFIKNKDRIVLDEWPVVSIQSIKHDGDALVANTDYFLEAKTGVIKFIPGTDPTTTEPLSGLIEVDYVAGFSSTPERVKIACLRAGDYWFNRRGGDGVGAVLISDLQQTFRVPEIGRILEEELGTFHLKTVFI